MAAVSCSSLPRVVDIFPGSKSVSQVPAVSCRRAPVRGPIVQSQVRPLTKRLEIVGFVASRGLPFVQHAKACENRARFESFAGPLHRVSRATRSTSSPRKTHGRAREQEASAANQHRRNARRTALGEALPNAGPVISAGREAHFAAVSNHDSGLCSLTDGAGFPLYLEIADMNGPVAELLDGLRFEGLDDLLDAILELQDAPDFDLLADVIDADDRRLRLVEQRVLRACCSSRRRSRRRC